jgi:hypothetical protein
MLTGSTRAIWWGEAEMVVEISQSVPAKKSSPPPVRARTPRVLEVIGWQEAMGCEGIVSEHAPFWCKAQAPYPAEKSPTPIMVHGSQVASLEG